MENLPLFYIFSFLIFFLSIKLSSAADTITPSSFIRDGEKLVSSSERFELGFFSPGKSRYRYLGIWYKQVPDTAVWVANRDSPIFDQNAVLTISSNGNLVLLNQTNGTIWSSNTSRQVKNPVAQLLDTGNLVVMANSSRIASESYLWQSFHYPTDTLLQGMKLGWDLKTGLERYQTSWRSADDPSPGNFTSRLDIHVLPEICTYKGSAKFKCTGPWNGIFFGAVPSSVKVLYEPIMVDNEDEIYYSYNAYNSPIIMMLKLQPSGELQRLVWNERSNEWQDLFSAPTHFCYYYGSCGANSFCSFNKTPNCKCLKGFKLKSQQNQTLPRTCIRSHSSECKSGDRFMKLDDTKLPDLLEVSLNKSMNLKECEAECLKNCTCIAYANSKVTDGGSGCLMWFGDLIDLRNTLEHNGQPIYIRVPATKLGNKKLLWILIVFLPLVLLLAFFIFFRWRTKHKETETKTSQDLVLFDINMSTPARENEFYKGDKGESSKSGDSWFPIFSLASVSAATNNFSEENKLGEGGFGPVYKGQLLNGQEVAIKRLSSQSGQGLEEFKNELKLIAKLQHRNLVRLLGCCIEEGEKVLIYEYMSNKSLDLFLFDPTKEGLLNWGTRVRIIEGIAQGLLYLHQYSRLRVIHRDLKASNILLDGDMNPKISDFGMARMFGEDELQLNTKRIVGTYGYMSPEYALHGRFSIKSDVFSFGVLLLEILTSKRNTGFHKTNSLTLIGHTWAMWKDDRAWELMDPVLQHEASYLIVMRYINVALLCVQEDAAYRPTMSEVVSMLTNEMLNLPSPQQPAFSSLKNSDLHSNTENEACSLNFLTISVVDAR